MFRSLAPAFHRTLPMKRNGASTELTSPVTWTENVRPNPEERIQGLEAELHELESRNRAEAQKVTDRMERSRQLRQETAQVQQGTTEFQSQAVTKETELEEARQQQLQKQELLSRIAQLESQVSLRRQALQRLEEEKRQLKELNERLKAEDEARLARIVEEERLRVSASIEAAEGSGKDVRTDEEQTMRTDSSDDDQDDTQTIISRKKTVDERPGVGRENSAPIVAIGDSADEEQMPSIEEDSDKFAMDEGRCNFLGFSCCQAA